MGRVRQFLARAIGPRSFSAIVILVGVLLFCLPVPDMPQVKLLSRAVRSPAEIAIVGPSVVDTISRCDADTRTIPAMLSADTHQQVSDLSDPGQPMADEINLAAAASHGQVVRDVILPIAPAAIDEWTTPPYRKLLAYKLISPRFTVFRAANISDFWSGVALKPERAQRAFSFGPHRYPDYRVVSATEFAREKRLATCPEPTTHDPAFTKAYYWWMYVAGRPNPSLYGMLDDLNHYLGARGQKLHVVLLPLNQDLLRGYSTDWAATAIAQQRRMAAELVARHVPVVDLTTLLRGDQFITPWCACTHLSDRGRALVAQAIAADITSPGASPDLASNRQADRYGI